MMFPEKSATFPDHASVCERLATGMIRCPVSAHIAFGAMRSSHFRHALPEGNAPVTISL
jgi:hypothetical protein